MTTEKLVLRKRNLALLIGIVVVVIGAIFSGAVSAVETPLAKWATPAKTGIRKSVPVEYGKGLGPPEEIVKLQPQGEIMLTEVSRETDSEENIVKNNFYNIDPYTTNGRALSSAAG